MPTQQTLRRQSPPSMADRVARRAAAIVALALVGGLALAGRILPRAKLQIFLETTAPASARACLRQRLSAEKVALPCLGRPIVDAHFDERYTYSPDALPVGEVHWCFEREPVLTKSCEASIRDGFRAVVLRAAHECQIPEERLRSYCRVKVLYAPYSSKNSEFSEHCGSPIPEVP